jgi:trigger factor
MEITLSDRDKNNMVHISIETEAGRAKEEYKKTLRKFSQDLDIPGFRKGKAPVAVIEARVGTDVLRNETMNFYFLSELLFEAFQKENLEVAFIPKIEKVIFDDPEGKVFLEAEVELFPEVKLGDYKKLQAKVEIPKFSLEESIEQTLQKIAGQFTVFEEGSGDTAIEKGDEVVFDFDGEVKGDDGTWTPRPGMKAENYQSIIEPGRFIENFLEQMIGMKTGDEKLIDVKFPEGYFAAELSGKDARFKIKVHKISRAKTPNIDDELAKKVNLPSAEELRAKVKEQLNKIQERNKESAAGDTLLDKLIEVSEVEIPQAMINREIEQRLQSIREEYGLKEEQIESLRTDFNADTEMSNTRKKLQKSLLITAIVRTEKLEIAGEELNKAFEEFFTEHEMNNIDEKKLKNKLTLDLLTNKVVRLLMDAADIEYVEVDNPPHGHEGHIHSDACRH